MSNDETTKTNNTESQNDKQVKLKTKFRTTLPAKMFDRSQIGFWANLKQFIGKELTKIAMPVAWCEPLTMLHRITENVNYCDLLGKAADPSLANNPCKRLEYIAAFAVSTVSANVNRISKPFNPLLGETFELSSEDLEFKIICEQVSHHPPISAFHSESTNPKRDWKFHGSINPKIKFWGKSIEVYPKGTLTLELGKLKETYTWQQVTCCLHNIIIGKLWFEYYGTMEIVCIETGYKAVLNFKPYSWFNKEMNRVDGFIYDKNLNRLRALYGYWTHVLYSCDPEEYDEYMRSYKQLPMIQTDEHFNEIGAPVLTNNNHQSLSNIHSFTNLKDLENNGEIKFDLDLNIQENDSSDSNPISHLTTSSSKKLAKKSTDSITSSASLPGFTGQADKLDLFEIWRVLPRPSYASDYYGFNYFTMILNELNDELKNKIAPTDSRFRTDVRQLELGNLDAASDEKHRLEEKQRQARNARNSNNNNDNNEDGEGEYKPKWFDSTKHTITQEDTWVFNNKYWLRDFKDCPDLFS